MIDFQNITVMTEQQILQECHNNTAVIPLVAMYFLTIVVSLIAGYIIAPKTKGKINAIVGITALFTGIALIFFLLLPNTSQLILNFITRMI